MPFMVGQSGEPESGLNELGSPHCRPPTKTVCVLEKPESAPASAERGLQPVAALDNAPSHSSEPANQENAEARVRFGVITAFRLIVN